MCRLPRWYAARASATASSRAPATASGPPRAPSPPDPGPDRAADRRRAGSSRAAGSAPPPARRRSGSASGCAADPRIPASARGRVGRRRRVPAAFDDQFGEAKHLGHDRLCLLRTGSSAAPAEGSWRARRSSSCAVGAHLVGLRIDLDDRQRVVVDHVALAHAARAASPPRRACAGRSRSATPVLERRARHERHAGGVPRAAERAEHRPVVHRLRRRDRRVRIAHRRGDDEAALDDHGRLGAEERRPPQHQIGELADRDRPDLVRDAVGDRRVDRVLGEVALDPEVVVAPAGVASSGSGPRCCFILCAVCQVRVITSPTRPIACESLDIMLIAPRSCRMSSAAIVSRRMRDSAKATSSAIPGPGGGRPSACPGARRRC